MIRFCAHSFGCLNLVDWVYKWEYVPNPRWFLVMWTMNISLSNLISTWTNGDATMTAFHQSRAGNMQWRAWQFFSFIIFCSFASVFYQGQHSINARMQHILSILFVVVFEIALTWWVMTPFLPLFMLLCLWQVNDSDTVMHSNNIKTKTQTKNRKHWLAKKFITSRYKFKT